MRLVVRIVDCQASQRIACMLVCLRCAVVEHCDERRDAIDACNGNLISWVEREVP